ncbi:MAG: YceI family protein [Carbonactinosporaceae bacterium]
MTETAFAPLTSLTGEYQLDPVHSRMGFAARHAMVATVHGEFAEFSGTAWLDGDDPANSRVELTIDAASIASGNADRDAHLRAPDFLDVERYPQITFRSTGTRQVDDETFALTGDLTIRDVTRPVEVPFTLEGQATDPFGNARVGFSGQASINRKDWGLTWNVALESGGILVGDKIKLLFDISAVRQR